MALEIGLLFSTTGPYAALGQAALAGARLALAHLRAETGMEIAARVEDPGGRPESYERLTDAMLASGRVRHVVGAITSWSRKDLIPVMERHGALLWYPCPYEGFECNDHVVYLGAAPNHHIVPLVQEMAANGARRVYLLGSNYVWGWETLRLARERFGAAGAEIVAERFVPLGARDIAKIRDEIADQRPDVVVNSLIGPSNAAFMASLPRDPAARPQVVSCNQTEADLDRLGPRADGMLSAGSFFESRAPAPFVRAARAVAPNGRCSSFLATSYAAVRLMAGAVAAAGTDDPRVVFRAVSGRWHDTVLGPVEIDPLTRHAALTPHLARARQGRFEIAHVAPAPVPADPYLSRLPPLPVTARGRPNLRIVP